MGENNHGIEPESSEQGTFSKNHLKTGLVDRPSVTRCISNIIWILERPNNLVDQNENWASR